MKISSGTSRLNIWRNTNKIVHLTGVDANGDGKEDDIVSSNLFIGSPLVITPFIITDQGHIYQLKKHRCQDFMLVA